MSPAAVSPSLRRPACQLPGPRRQRGVVLVISLLMLAAATMLAVASINLSDSSLNIASNTQSERRTVAAVDRAIEDTLSNKDNFLTPKAQKFSADGITIARSAPQCVHSEPMAGNSRNLPVGLQRNYYEFTVQGTDGIDGAGNRVQTGVRMLMNADTCN